MADVIEINAADSEVAKLFDRGGGFDMGKDRGLRFESKRDKTGETAGLILQLAQLAQMVNAMSQGLDVSVEHGARAPATHGVPDAMIISSIAYSKAWASRFLAAKAQNWQESTQMLE